MHKFAVRAIDAAGNVDDRRPSGTWTVVTTPTQTETSTGTVPPGSQGTVSSDPGNAGPTAENPVTTAVEVPTAAP